MCTHVMGHILGRRDTEWLFIVTRVAQDDQICIKRDSTNDKSSRRAGARTAPAHAV
jgi:hypothetical protein